MKQKFKRSFDELQNIVTMTETVFRKEGIQPELRHVVDLATEELFVNMVTYNTESHEDILIRMEPHQHGIEVTLTDYDVERFDPTAAGTVDVDAPLSERTPGPVALVYTWY
jgi:anti-sigma regulatory factor (Ser/Thr protein kinase)